ADAPLEHLSLEELMGVQVRSATLQSQPMVTVPSVISVITDDQIHALGLRTLADALELMPGVTVLATQFGGQRVIVRGKGGASDVLVTLDGERLNDFYDGAYLMEFPLENVARIELIRGPGSALYGTNAFAGVISIYSKSTPEIFAGLGAEMYFDHSLGWGVRAHAKFARSFGRWTVQLFGSYWDGSGPKVLVQRDNAAPTGSLVPAETNGAMRVAVAQLSIKRESTLVRGDLLELWALYDERRRGPYFGPNNVFAPDSHLERSAVQTYLAYTAPLGAGVRLQHRFVFDRRAADSLVEDQPPGFFHDVDGNFTPAPGELFPDGKFRSFSFVTYRLAEWTQLDWTLPKPRGIRGNHLVVGAELEYSWLPSFTYGQNFCCGEAYTFAGPTLRNWDNLPLPQVDKDRLLAAVFAHDELQLLRHLWITVGLRLDYFSDFGAAWDPRAAIVYQPHPRLSLKLLYGRAFRAPTFRDLYDQTGVSETPGGVRIMGNPNLRPETTNTVELSAESTPQRLITLRANAFYIRTDDVIEVDATSTVLGTQLINYPGRQIWGGEAEAQLHFDDRNYLSANLSMF
ncbi:MAG TPA: TonB-dependent receptor, partial [Polyangia bacterium]